MSADEPKVPERPPQQDRDARDEDELREFASSPCYLQELDPMFGGEPAPTDPEEQADDGSAACSRNKGPRC